LQAGLPTIYQRRPKEIIFFDSNGATLISSAPKQAVLTPFLQANADAGVKMVWALIDSNDQLETVDSGYLDARVFVIQTPSPRNNSMEWRKKSLIKRFVLEPWSFAELVSGWV
jgi:hypothetical protein